MENAQVHCMFQTSTLRCHAKLHVLILKTDTPKKPPVSQQLHVSTDASGIQHLHRQFLGREKSLYYVVEHL